MRSFKAYLCCLLLLSLSCKGCKWPWGESFERNPNLKPLLKKEGKNLFNPVWSPDGKRVYYLCASWPDVYLKAGAYAMGGDLWVVDVETLEDRRLLDKRFCSLAISPDGAKLALSYEPKNSSYSFEGGVLILVDPSGGILDTLPTSLPRILDVEFDSEGTKLFYYAYSIDGNQSDSSGFYSINIDGTDEQLIKREGDWQVMSQVGFDLDADNSVYYKYSPPRQYCPQFNPVESNYILYVTGNVSLGPSELKLLDTSTGATTLLDAYPFGPPEDYSVFQSGYWSPDGDKIVISVAEWPGGGYAEGVRELELWVLETVW